jgi:hypothetical protein
MPWAAACCHNSRRVELCPVVEQAAGTDRQCSPYPAGSSGTLPGAMTSSQMVPWQLYLWSVVPGRSQVTHTIPTAALANMVHVVQARSHRGNHMRLQVTMLLGYPCTLPSIREAVPRGAWRHVGIRSRAGSRCLGSCW